MANDLSVRIPTLAGLTLASLLGACGGGGGGGAPVSFSFASSTVTLAEDAATNDVVIVLHTSFPALTEDVTVEVIDAGTGTATSGADYTAFPTQTITFLTGAVDGATQLVTLDPLDDLLVEAGNETVRLRLQNPSLGEGLAGPTQHVATLTDIHEAQVSFATPNETLPGEGGGAQPVALELDCGTGVSLGVAVSVRVSDLRTGSAAPASDYSSFAAQVVTFPLGSPDGDVKTVNLTVVDDTTLESNETVRLGLSAPSITCTLGPTTVHELTIQDDDLALNAFFLATEGPGGTGNTLAYDEILALGTQSVGAGPNAGTLVRVTNGGGTPMELGAPSLLASSANENDFSVDIESSALTPGDAGGFPAVDAPTPLVALEPDGGPGLALRIDAGELRRLGALRHAVLHGFALPELGPVTLDLRRRPLPFSADARLAIDGREIAGGPRTLVGDLQLWAGSVVEMPGSRVFLSLDGASAQGFIELPLAHDRFVHFLADGPGVVRLVRDAEMQALGFGAPEQVCAGELFAPDQAAPLGMPSADEPPPAALTVADCRIAFETDWQLYQKFGSSVLLTNYVTELVGAVSEQYFTDVQAQISIAYLGIHTTSNDGWSAQDSGGDTGAVLSEFRDAWTDPAPNTRPPGAVGADLAHFLSGADLGGGIAYVDVLCNQSVGFGVSELNANINWATWTGAAGNFTWDFVVVAHELGHNFGSQHTHSYCPPLDQCYTNCNGTSACPRGTLMSYCHLCGGMSNIDLLFHPVTANIMRQRVNASCLDDALLGGGDFVQYRVRFNPLTTTGAKSATLEFTHDATNESQPFRVRLSGTAN